LLTSSHDRERVDRLPATAQTEAKSGEDEERDSYGNDHVEAVRTAAVPLHHPGGRAGVGVRRLQLQARVSGTAELPRLNRVVV